MRSKRESITAKGGSSVSGKIATITSAVQGNGSKYLATNLAFDIKKRKKDKRVLLIDFDFDNPFLAYPFVSHDEVHGIDNLVNSITENEVSDELFLENIIETSVGVHVLRGTRFIEKPKMFSQQKIGVILKKAKQLYDHTYVVVNCKANNAGTIVSLMETDQVILVLRNNHSNLMRVERALKLIQQYSSVNEIKVVYNFKNVHIDVDINSKFESYPVKILGVLEYEEKGIDNLNLMKKDSLFSRSVNAKVFSNINEKLWK